MRVSKTEYYLEIARAIAQRSTCLRAKFGAIIVKNDVIVSSGYNGAARKVKECPEFGICLKEELKLPHGSGYDVCPGVHAEANAIVNAARSGANVLGGVMFIHGEDPNTKQVVEAKPCTFCRRLLINAGIEKVFYKKQDGSIGEYNIHEWIRDESLRQEAFVKEYRERGEVSPGA